MARTLANRTQGALAIRADAFSQMSPQLKEKCKDIQKGIVERSEGNLRFYWQLGNDCVDIRDNPKKYLTDEQQAQEVDPFGLLQRFMSTSKDTLIKAARFADRYERADLERLVKYRNTSDPKYRLNWAHVVNLITVDTKAERIRFERAAVNDLLQPMDLLKLIQKSYGGSRRAGSGRALGIPRSIQAQINQINSVTKTWLNRHTQVWHGPKHSVYTNLMQMPPDDVTTDTLKDVQEICDVMDAMLAAVTEERATAERTLEKLKDTLAKQKSGGSETAATNGHAKKATAGKALAVKATAGKTRGSSRAAAAVARAKRAARPVPAR